MDSINPLYRSREAIEQDQLASLQRVLEINARSNPFWQNKWSAAGTDWKVQSLREFTERFPLTTKEEIAGDQAGHPPFGTNLAFEPERYVRFHQTSGTTGRPLCFPDCEESWSALVEHWKEVYLAAGTSSSDRVFFAFSFGPFIGFWLAFDAAASMGCLCVPGGGMSSAARLNLMSRSQATVLCCTPTYAFRLAETARAEGVDLGELSIKTIIVAGEPGGCIPEVRDRFSKAWPGARMFDHHGMTEMGPVTYECPSRRGGLRVIEAGYLAEIVDPKSGESVSKGQTGELVLTSLKRIGCPLFRYRTGDLVREGDADSGPWQNMLLEGGILGRVDDMVVVRGVNIYPSAVEAVVRGIPEIAEYQALLAPRGEMTELRLEVEIFPDAGRSADEIAGALGRRLQTAFNLRVPVKVVPPESLPRFEMKARRWRILAGACEAF